MNRQTMLDLLRRSGDDLKRYVSEIPPDRLHWHVDNEWSAHETLAHVCEIERHVFIVRMQRVAAEHQPLLKYFDEAAWHGEHYDPTQPVADLLADFTGVRGREIALLEAQPDWSRWGLHEKAQKRYSLEFIALYALHHTWEHLNQIANTQLEYELAQQG
ncbi:MAG TPA: DinB family protein [Anaerolineae bacterium]